MLYVFAYIKKKSYLCTIERYIINPLKIERYEKEHCLLRNRINQNTKCY